MHAWARALRYAVGLPALTAALVLTAAPAPAARAAGDPLVTIADFHFGPAAITVPAGATITWTNTSPMPHTATASGGGFNTGVVLPGHSASLTFSRPGTYAYFCQIHPFMHGTVTVLAAAPATRPATTTTAPAPAAATPTSPTPATTATPASATSGPSLPRTGLDLGALLAGGLLALALGLVLRRATRR